MLSAIEASTGRPGTCTQPSVAPASVRLCAAVNAVTATPVFPAFFVVLHVLMATTSTAALVAVLLVALGWSWAGICLLQGLIVIYTLMVVVVNLVTDLTYGFLDPRVQYK